MQRLRDKRPAPGSVEEALVESVKACDRLVTSPIVKRRVYVRVLDAAIAQRPKGWKRSRVRSAIGWGLLLLAGLVAASTAGRRSARAGGGTTLAGGAAVPASAPPAPHPSTPWVSSPKPYEGAAGKK